MFSELATESLFHTFLVFCRVGSALMLFPGIAELYVPTRVRLLLALAISVLMVVSVGQTLPPVPGEGLVMLKMLFAELAIGLFIGALTRMVQSALHIAGMIIAFQSSLASAMLFDSSQGSQGSVVGNFMTLTGMVLLFTSGLHHVMLMGVAESYLLFPPASLVPFEDFAELASTTMAQSFLVAVKISAPLIVIGLLTYLGGGIMGRLMPAMQVFFVLIPVQLYVSLALFMLTFSIGMLWYLQYMEDALHQFYLR